MNHYQDINLIPDAEANLGFLWEKVFQQMHLAMTNNKTSSGISEVGICFPEYNSQSFPLGSKLRIFAQSADNLVNIDVDKYLKRLSDYTRFTSIKAVPTNVSQYALFMRKQFDTNALRLAKRRAKRKGETIEQALEYYSDFRDRDTRLPYINTISLSTDRRNKFRLFIEREFVDSPSSGNFNCYGLTSRDKDKQATVPWF